MNRQMPCPPRSTVPANQAQGGRFFTLPAQFALGHGGDHSRYVLKGSVLVIHIFAAVDGF
jgi:hypothetical protein